MDGANDVYSSANLALTNSCCHLHRPTLSLWGLVTTTNRYIYVALSPMSSSIRVPQVIMHICLIFYQNILMLCAYAYIHRLFIPYACRPALKGPAFLT